MKYFSMFSGIGGFEYGLQNSKYNFECVGFSEVDKYAKSIYIRQFPNHKDFGDATKIQTEELPNFDFLVGGFPCQAFSNAGKRRGFNDTRGTLFFEIARVLKDKRPRYFLLENVRGLLSHNKGKTFQTILEVLSDLGYELQWTLLNSKDFGVPQRRERVFIEGYFRGKGGREILSIRRNCKKNSNVTSGKVRGKGKVRVYNENEIKPCLTAEGQNSGGRSFIKCDNLINKKDKRERVLKRISPANSSQGTRVYDSDGLSIALNASGNNDFYKVKK